MCADLRTIDVGIRDAVAALNRIPGVTTQTSCQGAGLERSRHRHADLAYVGFRYPLPLHLEEFLVARLGPVARVEENGIFSRWLEKNRSFIEQLAVVADSYLALRDADLVHRRRWPLARLRTRLAHYVARATDLGIGWCCDCATLTPEPHADSHRVVALFRLPAEQESRWFEEFVHQPSNALDGGLIAQEGWRHLMERTKRAEFGRQFQRRWLRHRSQMLARLATVEVRAGCAAARHAGVDIDFYYDRTHALFAWSPDVEIGGQTAAACADRSGR